MTAFWYQDGAWKVRATDVGGGQAPAGSAEEWREVIAAMRVSGQCLAGEHLAVFMRRPEGACLVDPSSGAGFNGAVVVPEQMIAEWCGDIERFLGKAALSAGSVPAECSIEKHADSPSIQTAYGWDMEKGRFPERLQAPGVVGEAMRELAESIEDLHGRAVAATQRAEAAMEARDLARRDRDEAIAARAAMEERMRAGGWTHVEGAPAWKPPVNERAGELWRRLLEAEAERDEWKEKAGVLYGKLRALGAEDRLIDAVAGDGRDGQNGPDGGQPKWVTMLQREWRFEELFAELKGWWKVTFPEETLRGVFKHLKEEIGELDRALKDPRKGYLEVQDEVADCLMLLCCVCYHLQLDPVAAMRAKHAVNVGRKWVLTEKGYRHVKEGK